MNQRRDASDFVSPNRQVRSKSEAPSGRDVRSEWVLDVDVQHLCKCTS